MADQDNVLGLALIADLNIGKSVSNLNERLKQLANHPSLKKLELKIDIDDSFVGILNKFNSNASKFGDVLKSQSKVVQEFVTETIRLDGSIEKVTKQILANGEQIEKTKVRHDQNKKSIQDESNAYAAQARTLQQLEKELDGYTLASQRANKNKYGQTTSYSNTYQNNNNPNDKVTVRTDQTGNIKNLTAVNNYLKQQQQLEKQAEAVDRAHYSALKDQNAKEEALDKAHYQALKMNASLDLKRKQENVKQVETIDRAHYQALKTNQQREEAADKQHYLALQQNAQRDLKYKQDILKAQQALDNARLKYSGSSTDRQNFDNLQGQLNGIKNIGNYSNDLKNFNSNLQQTSVAAKGSASGVSEFVDHIGKIAIHIPVIMALHSAFSSVFNAVSEGFRGMVQLEANMAGYVQTNEQYYETVNKTLDQSKINEQTKQFIQTAHDLGAEIDQVTESARLWGRMYKDVNVVQELVRQSTQLSTVDLVSLEDATKGMESVLAQYGVQIKNVADAQLYGNRILDSWSKVAHDTMAPAADLAAAFERTGKIADETGVSFDFMNGLISAGIRNTALSGQNLGNMWKTVLGTIRTDKAVDEIEKLGVKTKEVVNGTEQWRKAEDILLELSTKVINKNYDLTQSYEDISRGVYQYAKLAASLNAGDILLGESASINSTGKTTEYLKIQLDTIQRKASQVKTSFIELFNTAGDNGLRGSLKSILVIIDELLLGINKIPSGITGATLGILGVVGAVAALKNPIANLSKAWIVWTTTKKADTAATIQNTASNTANALSTVEQTVATESKTVATGLGTIATKLASLATKEFTASTAAASVVMGIATAGISIAIGLLATWAVAAGSHTKQIREQNQELEDQVAINNQLIDQAKRQVDFLPKAVNVYRDYNKLLREGNLSDKQSENIKRQLLEVQKSIVETIGEEGFQRLQNQNFSEDALKSEIDLINKAAEAQRELNRQTLLGQKKSAQDELDDLDKQISKLEEKIEKNKQKQVGLYKDDDRYRDAQDVIDKTATKLAELKQKQDETTKSLNGYQSQLDEINGSTIDQLAGAMGKVTEGVDGASDALEEFNSRLDDYGSQLKDINQTIADVNKGQSINAESVNGLIKKYPQLAGHITKVADGWKIEKSALSDLRTEIVDAATKDIEQQKQMSINTLTESLKRIKIYGTELGQISSIAEAKQKLNDLQKSELPTNAFNIPSVTELNNFLKDNKDQAIDALKQLIDGNEDAQNQLDDLLKTFQDTSYGIDKASDGMDQFKSSVENTNEVLTEQQKSLQRVNDELDKLQSKRSRLKKGSDEYNKSLEQELSLLKQQRGIYSEAINHPEQLISTKVKTTTTAKGSDSSAVSNGSSLSSSNNISNLIAAAQGLEGKFTYKQVPGEYKGSYEDFVKGAISDCSQFVQELFKQFTDTNLPRTAAQQFKTGTAVDKKDLQTGDLVFFNTTGKTASHVGVYQGNGKFIQMGNHGLSEQDLNSSYWKDKYDGARRVVSGGSSASSSTSSTSNSSGNSKTKTTVKNGNTTVVTEITPPTQKELDDTRNLATSKVNDYDNQIYQKILDIIDSEVITTSQNKYDWLDRQIGKSQYSQSLTPEYSKTYRDEESKQSYYNQQQIDNLNKRKQDISAYEKKYGVPGAFSQEQIEIDKQILQLEMSINEHRKNIATSQIAEYDRNVESLSNDLDNINAKMGLLEEGSKEYNSLLASTIPNLRNQQKEHEKAIDVIQKQLQSDKLTAAVKSELISQLQDETKAWQDNEAAIKSNMEKEAELRASAADRIIDDLKKAIQEKEQLEEDALDKEIESENERHKQIKDNLQDEYDAFEKNINAQLKSLDRNDASEDYETELNKKLKDRQKLIDEINTLSLDDSASAKKKRQDLQEQLDAKNDEIDKFKLDRERELRKEGLQDQLDDRKNYLDKAQDAEDKQNEDTLKNINKEKDAVKKQYEDMLNNEEYFYKLKQGLLSSDASTVKKTLDEISSKYSVYFDGVINGADSADQAFKNLNYTVQQALNTINKYQNGDYSSPDDGVNSGYTPPSYTPGTNDSNDPSVMKDWQNYLSNKQKAEAIKELMKAADPSTKYYQGLKDQFDQLKQTNDGLRSSHHFKEGSYAELKGLTGSDIFSAETGGLTPPWGSGGKFLLAHEKELVLNKTDTSKLLNAVNIVRDFAMPSLDWMKSLVTNNHNTQQSNDRSVHIENIIIQANDKDTGLSLKDKLVTAIDQKLIFKTI